MVLSQLLSKVHDSTWVVIGNSVARLYEGYADDFNSPEFLSSEVMGIHLAGNDKLYILV